MKTRYNTIVAGTLVLAATSLAGILAVRPVQAQDAAGAAPAPAPASRAGTRPASDVLARIAQGTGLTVLADSTVANERIPLPAEAAATPETLEARVAEVVRALPPGTTWAKLYLPAPAGGRAWTGDDVAEYAFAQKRLFGQIGAAPAGTVEILGQRIPEDRAAAFITGLNLKPVYLVTNPSLRPSGGAGGGTAQALTADAARWAKMTPEQQQAYARQQAQQVLNMDPALRRQVFEQQRSMMRAVIQQMTPEQRQQLFQGTGGGPRGGRRGGGQRGPGATP